MKNNNNKSKNNNNNKKKKKKKNKTKTISKNNISKINEKKLSPKPTPTSPNLSEQYKTDEFLFKRNEIRERIMKKEVNNNKHKFSEYIPMNFFLGTWNVNEKNLNLKEYLIDWISPKSNNNKNKNNQRFCPDLIALGFQEIDMSVNSVLVNDTSKSKTWIEKIEKELKILKEKYFCLSQSQISGILLIIYVLEKHKKNITNIQIDQVACGIMNVLGNKGGVAIRFNWFDTKIVIINSHLACSLSKVERRNQDQKTISDNLAFISKFTQEITTKKKKKKKTIISLKESIFDQDLIFWMGDLNYRIRYPNRQEVLKMISDSKFQELEIYDQLKEQIRLGNVFKDFSEGKLNFAPSYKFNIGTCIYDTSDKKKLPAWTDRILWKSKIKKLSSIINQKYYKCYSKFLTSDHKPVASLLNLKLFKIIPEKKKLFRFELSKKIDLMEMSFRPQAKLSNNLLDFGSVFFQVPNSKKVILKNIGQVFVHFKFIPKEPTPEFQQLNNLIIKSNIKQKKRKKKKEKMIQSFDLSSNLNKIKKENILLESKEQQNKTKKQLFINHSRIAKTWIQIDKPNGVILPGEEQIIKFTIKIDKKTAFNFNSKKEKIDDILVLHIEGSKDFFIDIKGEWQQTSFGMNLQTLSKIFDPIRYAKDFSIYPIKNQTTIPKELWRLIDYIFKNGIDEYNIFLETGDEGEMIAIREALDTNSELPINFSIYSYSETLITFLDSLHIPIIPYSLYEHFFELTNYLDKKALLESLPKQNYHVFVYLIAFLQQVLKKKDENQLDPYSLALIFSRVMIKAPNQLFQNSKTKIKKKEIKKRAQFILLFLQPKNG
jgi:hypothetical protein